MGLRGYQGFSRGALGKSRVQRPISVERAELPQGRADDGMEKDRGKSTRLPF